MNLKDRFNELSAREMVIDQADADRIKAICDRIPGWSGPAHYAFFRTLLQLPIQNLLVLGVYHGRDLAFIADIFRREHQGRDIWVHGVDRFTADPCADWLPTKGPRTWEEETNGLPPPSFEAAIRNTAEERRIVVTKCDAFEFMETTALQFDAIYLDTSHDYATVSTQIRQTKRVIRPGGIVCGDDFSDKYTWGVKSAVEQGFKIYTLFGGWIWAAFDDERK